jgi:hypothetical protein
VLEYICKEQLPNYIMKNIKVRATIKTSSGTLDTFVTMFKDSVGKGDLAKGIAKISGKKEIVYSTGKYATTWFTDSGRVTA